MPIRRFAIALLALALATPAWAPIAPGTRGPPVTHTAHRGASTSLSQYAGKVVVLFLLGYS